MFDQITRRNHCPQVLVVEDNDDDVLLAREAFDRCDIEVKLHRVRHGEECMAFLRNEGETANQPLPDLILLDLNMPVMDGREVLAELLKDERLRRIPVVVLTTSKRETDIADMYDLKCSSYAQKPVDFKEFAQVIQGIASYYFSVAALPGQQEYR